ncbi:hypothetical protein ES708_17614 [subsurface metagenome]
MTRELLPGELSWADSFIIDLLSDEEKYQDEIRDLTSSAVMDAIATVAESSEQMALGFLESYHTATGLLDRAANEVNEEVDDEVSKTSRDTKKANNEADKETGEETWRAERATSGVLIQVNADITEELDRFLGINKELWRGVGLDIDKMQQDIDAIQEDFPGFIAEQTAGLMIIPFTFLFDRFINTFFEEA